MNDDNNGKDFVDTNVLIYAYDIDAKAKHDIAVARIKQLWQTKTGIISTQVLQEFYVNITRKIANPFSLTKAQTVLKRYLSWQVVTNTPEMILLASEIQVRHLLSFWDALTKK
jgi:predicted nucleic acid-binding protein